jgi:hypothetical protein
MGNKFMYDVPDGNMLILFRISLFMHNLKKETGFLRPVPANDCMRETKVLAGNHGSSAKNYLEGAFNFIPFIY